MPISRLELISSYGDQTLNRVRFVVHGSSNATESVSILDEGLRFVEGRPTLSTNIVHAHDWTVNPQKQAQSHGMGEVLGEPGDVMVCAVPPNLHLGYGIFTTAYVDRMLKRVSGAPLRYAAGRKQLSFYKTADTEASRVHVESEVANGYLIDQMPQLLLEPKYVIGRFAPSPVFDSVVTQLDVAVRSMQPLEYERLETSLHELFRPTIAANAAYAASAIHDIIIGTVESVVISRLRMMRWQGLALLGFTFFEGKQPVKIAPVKDLTEQQRRMDELGRTLASSALFTAELGWLKDYVAHELELMRLELEAAELESMPD